LKDTDLRWHEQLPAVAGVGISRVVFTLLRAFWPAASVVGSPIAGWRFWKRAKPKDDPGGGATQILSLNKKP